MYEVKENYKAETSKNNKRGKEKEPAEERINK